MKDTWRVLGAVVLATVGCRSAPPPAPASPVVVQAPVSAPTKVTVVAPAPVVALVEPYLVVSAAPRLPSLPSLRGQILPDLRNIPILPSPPIQTVPVEPTNPLPTKPTPVSPAPSPRRSSVVSPVVVRLFEDERARSVADAGRRLAAASVRAAQTAAEAKRQWGFVKDGFVAQKQAESADATARDAAAEQADAQKALDEAQSRQRNARRDIEAALRVAATPSPFALAELAVPARSYQPVPQTYRLSVLGASTMTITVQNGTLGRRLDPQPGEAGAWLVRCPDPSRLRVGVGVRPATVVVRPLPDLQVRSKT